MSKKLLNEISRLQKLAGITEAPQWTSTSTDPSLTDRKPNLNRTAPKIPGSDIKFYHPDSPMGKAMAKATPKRLTKTGADRNPRSTKFYVNLKVKEKYSNEDYGVIKAVKNNWEEVKNRPIKGEYIGTGTFLTDKNKNEPWYLVQLLNSAPFPDEFKSDPSKKDDYERFLANRGIYFDPENPYNGTPLWYPEEELENVPYGVPKQLANKKDKRGLREEDDYDMGTPSGDTDSMNIAEDDFSATMDAVDKDPVT